MNKKQVFEHFKHLSSKNSQHMNVTELSVDSIVFTVRVNYSEHHIMISVFEGQPVEVVELAVIVSSYLPNNRDFGYDTLYNLLERNNILVHAKYALRENMISLIIRCTMQQINKQFLGEAVMLLTSEVDSSKGILGLS